jgi:hypothetical protein
LARFGANLQTTSTFLALLDALFRQFQGEVRRTPLLRTRANKESGILGFLLLPMADRFDVVAVRIENEGSIE